MGTRDSAVRDPADRTAPATAVRHIPSPVTATLLALYAAAAAVGAGAGGTAERLLAPVLLATVVLRLLAPRRWPGTRPRGGTRRRTAPPPAARGGTTGSGNGGGTDA